MKMFVKGTSWQKKVFAKIPLKCLFVVLEGSSGFLGG